jgi:hypothetical protein
MLLTVYSPSALSAAAAVAQRTIELFYFMHRDAKLPVLVGFCPLFDILPTKMPTNNFCPPNACFLKILINEEKSQI